MSVSTRLDEHQSGSDDTELTLSWKTAYTELAATAGPLFTAFALSGRLGSAERVLTIGLICLVAFGAFVTLVTPRRLVLTDTELRIDRALPVLSRRLPWETVLRFDAKSPRWVRYALRPGMADGGKAGWIKAWYRSETSTGALSTEELARLLNRRVVTAELCPHTVPAATPARIGGLERVRHEPSTTGGRRLPRGARLALPAAALAFGTVALLGDETTAEDGPFVVALSAVLASCLMLALVACITWVVMRRRRSWSFAQTVSSTRVAILTVLLIAPSF